MEANQKKKFVCKFCDKRYPCGKSLGGHIRIHLTGSSNDATEETILNTNISNFYVHNQSQSLGSYNGSNTKRDCSGPTEAFLGGQSGYGLRENRKKTKRFVVDFSKPNMLQDKVCRECGKGFQSLKALCGHMACHSRNNNRDNLEDHRSGTSEKLKEIVMDGQSNSETSAPSKRRRSERVRYMTRCVYSNSANGSVSSGSYFEQEQEEVAECLLMMSKDYSFKGCFSSFGDSSDSDSVVLETKSLTAKAWRFGKTNGGSACEFDEFGFSEMKKAKGREEEAMSIENENDESENSDSGYFRNGPDKVRLDVSANEFARGDELQKKKVEPESGYGGKFDSVVGKRLSQFRCVKAEIRKNLVEQDGYRLAGRDAVENGSSNPGLIGSNDQKRCKNSALGDQKTSQKRTNRFTSYFKSVGVENAADTNNITRSIPGSSKNIQQSGNGKNTIQQNSTAKAETKLGSRKGKMHECPFCFKVFRSGQALGGHKRSHFVGSAEDRTLVIKEDMPEISMPALIDLNLPAPIEEEVDGFAPR